MHETDLGRLLLEGHRAFSDEVRNLLQERGYPEARAAHATLAEAIDRRSGSRLTDLARRARMTKQGMMLLVDDMESKGYVRRVADPSDARAKIVKLTARGRLYVAEARRVVSAVETRARRRIGDRRYQQLRGVLAELGGEGEAE
jgi:DNA-binding MarR family transcriptional regulator